MLRALVWGLAILHLGPGFAFAVLAFGCDPAAPALGTMCQQSTLAAFLWLTAAAWLVMLLGLALRLALARRHRASASMTGASAP